MLLTRETLKLIRPPHIRWVWRRYENNQPNGVTGKYNRRIYLWCKQFLSPTKRDVKRHGGRGFPDTTTIRVLLPTVLADHMGNEGLRQDHLRNLIFCAQPTHDGGLFHKSRLWNILTDASWLGQPWYDLRLDEATDITEVFWDGYVKMGVCFIDREHTTFSTHRWSMQGDQQRTCLFCGKSFRKHEYEVPQPPVKMTEWLSVEE